MNRSMFHHILNKRRHNIDCFCTSEPCINTCPLTFFPIYKSFIETASQE